MTDADQMRVQRRWLLLARGLWITLVIFTLVTFFASLPVYIAQLQTPCVHMICAFQTVALAPGQIGALKEIGLSPGNYVGYTVALTLVNMLVCLVVSTLIIWRRSNDRMALIVALMLVTLGPIIATSSLLLSSSPWQVPNACLNFLTLALILLVFSLFPNGRFVPRWTRWTLLVCLAGQVPSTFFPNAPFTLHTPVNALGYLVVFGEAAVLAGVQFYRYRRVSNPMQRQQTKWVVYGLAMLVTVFVGGYGLLLFPALADPGSLYQLALAAITTWLPLFIPLSFGFAMLRYRLWDIDILINRTLVYGILTALLALIYVSLIFALQFLTHVLTGQAGDNPVLIVVSTLAIAALFQPLRHRIQATIDQRFYRRKYNAAKTVADFSATLRNEVNLATLSEHLVAVVQETMQPEHVSLWLRKADHESKRHQNL